MADQNTYLPPGQTALTDLPQYGGAGGGQQAAEYYAAQDFVKQFGRNPTQSELSMLAPSYIGGDPNVANLAGGKGSVAAYYNQQSQTPQNIYQQQQSQAQDAYNKGKSTIDPQINGIFQSQLGRDATTDELQHFGSLVATGQDPYQVQQALQQTTEYQNRATGDFTKRLGDQLQGSNADYFSKYIAPSLQAQAANSGRSYDASGVNAQLANAGKQQNYDLQNYLAGVSANQYGASTQNAYAQYNNLQNQQYGLQNAGVSNQLSNQAANQQYNQNLNMYQLQQQAYSNYLSQYGKRNGAQGIGSTVGGVIGGAAGAYFGGPTGALAGYQMGSSLGGTAGSYL